MKMRFSIGQDPLHRVSFERDPLLGGTVITVDGRVEISKPWWHVKSHLNLSPVIRYEFSVGLVKPCAILIEIAKPRLLSGFRPWLYRAFVDGKMIQQKTGY